MPKAIPFARVDELTRMLRGSACFTRVERQEVRHEDAEVVFSVAPASDLGESFNEGIRELAAARHDRPADNLLAAVLEGILLPRLDLEEFEVELEDDVDPDAPVLPETVTLVVRLKEEMKSRKKTKKRTKKTKKSGAKKRTRKKSKTVFSKKAKKKTKTPKKRRPDFSKMTEAERKTAARRDRERLRSLRRRAEKKEAEGGETRLGRVGYTEQVYDPDLGRLVWRATPQGRAVMREMDKVWEKTITSQAALARHLNVRGLKTMTGRAFTRNMMTDVRAHLDRLRGDAG